MTASGEPSLPRSPRYVFHRVGEDQGLATKTVTALLQDRTGYIWIGTQDGLFRHDGASFRRFDRSDGIPANYVNQVLEGPDGSIWVSTQGGLARFDGRRFERVRLELAPRDVFTEAQSLALSPDGDVFVATRVGLARRDVRGKETLVGPRDIVTAVAAAPDGTTWFAVGGQLWRLPKDGTAVFHVSLSSRDARTILVTPDGAIWVRTERHLLHLSAGSTSPVYDDDGLPGPHDFGAVSLDRSGEIWVPTPLGAFHKADGRWEAIGRAQGAGSDAVTAILEDREGTLWFGYGGGGLDRWPGRRHFSGWTVEEGLPNEVVWAITRDLRGRLWIGTSDGLAVWQPERNAFAVLKERDGLVGRTVRVALCDREGFIWAHSVPGGLTRVDSATLRPAPLPAWPADDPIVAIHLDPQGNVIVSSRKRSALARIDGGRVRFEETMLTRSLPARTWRMDFAGTTLWAGTRDGLLRFDGSTFRKLTTRDGLRTDAITNVAAVSPDEAWVGYLEGLGLTHVLLRGDHVEMRHVTHQDGLSTDTPFFLGLDAQGRVWSGGDSGVSVIGKDGKVRSFRRTDGLLWDDCSADGFLAEADGSVLIGTSRGLARYDPAGGDEPESPPPVVLTSVTIGGKSRLFENGITVPWRDRTFVATFAGLTFKNPSAVRYRYRLAGFEADGVETALHEARYASLPAGTYRFEVSCRSAAGIFSQTPALFSFVICPPWWQTAPFEAGLALVLGLLAFLVYRARVAHHVKARQHLEKVVLDRTRLLHQRNEELASAATKLSEAQRQIEKLREDPAASLSDLEAWVEVTAKEVALRAGLSTIEVWEVSGDRVTPLSGGSKRAPRPEEIWSAHGRVRETEGDTLLPLVGTGGDVLGALVLPERLSRLGPVERPLVEAFASHLATALDFRRLREQLRIAGGERARALVALEAKGIDTLRECPRCGRCFGAAAVRCSVDGETLVAERVLPLRVAGRYRLARFLGEGGMGAVFEAEDETEKRSVAMKIIRPEHCHDPIIKARVEREAQIVARLRHPSVVTLHDTGELADGSAYLVMELLQGLDLFDVLDRWGPGTPVQVARVVTQVADALEAAHELGVVHRDLKPANLFLVSSPEGFRCKVLDFGLAKSLGETTKFTRTGFVVGSPAYMSPEQIREEPLDARSDLFSLAAVTYELLTGKTAFGGTNVADTFTEILQREPPPLSERLGGVSRELERILFQALEKRRERRPKSVIAWVREIAPLLMKTQTSVAGWELADLAVKPRERSASGARTR